MKRRFGGLFGACLLFSLACGSADAWSSASSDPSCDGSTIELELEEQAAAASSSPMPTSTSKGRRTFYSLPSPFGPWPLPANASAARPMRLLVAEPIDACKELVVAGGNSSASSFALLVARGGGCSFLDKVKRAKEAGAGSVVVFNAGAQGCILLGVGSANSSSSAGAVPSREELEAMPLTVSVDAATGARLLAAASDASRSSASSSAPASAPASASTAALLRIFEPVPSGSVDGSALVLGLLAVSGLLIGALLASRDEVERRTRRRRTLEGSAAAAASAEEEEEEAQEDDEDEPLAFSSLSDVVFVVALMASALLAAFFFPKIFSFVLSALFVFGAGEATGSAASLLFARVFPSMKAREIALPSLLPAVWGKGSSGGCGGEREEEGMEEARNEPAPATTTTTTTTTTATTTTTTTVPAATLAGFALVAAPAALAWLLLGPRRVWPLHDLLALALVSSIPSALRLPSLRACAALLLLAACNDVFFVFGTPRLFPGTRSPMVSVATATPALVLLSPLQRGGPRAGFALLGFGDVVIPGACVAFAARWDALRRLKKEGAARGGAAEASSPSSSSPSPPPSASPSPRPPSFSSLAAAAASLACCFSTLWASVAGYALGLCLTYLALYHRLGGSAGQPALLFLSPCVLLAASAALCLRGGRGRGVGAGGRGELRAAWRGLDGGSKGEGREGSRRRGGDSENASLLAA